MKKITLAITLLISIILHFSCAKKGNDEIAPDNNSNPVTNTDNIPPAGGNFYLLTNANSEIVWTTDFVNYTKYSDRFNGVNKLAKYNDTLLLVTSNSIYYGNVYTPSDFKSINYNNSYNITSISYLKGWLAVTASNNGSYYYGSCNAKGGISTLSFSIAPSATNLNNISNLGHALIAMYATSSGNYLSYSKNGHTWTVTAESYYTDDYCFTNNNSVCRISGHSIYQTTDTTNFSSWNNIGSTLYSTNTSDSTGSFIPESAWKILKIGNKLISNGHISTGNNRLSAANVSTDLGNSWSTIRFKNVPNINIATMEIPTETFFSLNTNSILFRYTNSNGYELYKSTNGIDFTSLTLPADFSSIPTLRSRLEAGVYFN